MPIRRATRAAATLTLSLLLGACGGAAPELPHDAAASAVASWLPATQTSISSTEVDGDGVIAEVSVNGEALRFRFTHDENAGWNLEGMVTEQGVLDHAGSRTAWLDRVRRAREISLADYAAGLRPEATLEVVVTGLRIDVVTADEIRLLSIDEPELGAITVSGRHFDALPVAVGDEVALQVQGIERQGDGWIPERREIPGALMVELQPMDITLLALLKLRLGDRVVPVPYFIPEMAHDDHAHGPDA